MLPFATGIGHRLPSGRTPGIGRSQFMRGLLHAALGRSLGILSRCRRWLTATSVRGMAREREATTTPVRPGRAPWQADDAGEALVASVLLPTGPPTPLDYLVPDHLRAQIQVGQPRAGSAGAGGQDADGLLRGARKPFAASHPQGSGRAGRRAMPAQPADVSTQPVDRRPLLVQLEPGARRHAAGGRAATGRHAARDDGFAGLGRGPATRHTEAAGQAT